MIINKKIAFALSLIIFQVRAEYVELSASNGEIETVFRAKSSFFVSGGSDYYGVGVGGKFGDVRLLGLYNHKRNFRLTGYYRTNKSEYEYQLILDKFINDDKNVVVFKTVYYMFDDFGFTFSIGDGMGFGIRKKF